jgi:antitoxin (DNA-binding transcriptional repressor) of toxin-antitoxin stability system
MTEMDDAKLIDLRKLVGQHAKLVYEAVKAGMVAELPHESQLYAESIREHMHLKHIHNALEFADVREGEQYEITVEGETVNPMAHIAAHSAVKGQIEQDSMVRAAFEKLVATGTSAHHAEHVLGAILLETEWENAQAAEAGTDQDKAKSSYYRKIQKLIRDSVFRKKLTRMFTGDHSAFE